MGGGTLAEGAQPGRQNTLMRLPFSRTKDANHFKGIRSRSMLVRSAEVAMPPLRSTRTAEEHRAALQRIRERRSNGTV